MAKTEELIDIGFSLGGIKTEQFAIFEDNLASDEEVRLSTNLSFSIDKEKRNFRATSNFTYEMLEKPIITIQVSCFFRISDKLWEEIKKDNTMVFPKRLVIHMSMLTISTVRGVLHAMTVGTPFNKFFLPTVNVVKMIPDDVIFE